MESNEMNDEVKILHIHKGAEGKRDFIEYIDIRSGKTHILTDKSFIKRYGKETIEAFLAQGLQCTQEMRKGLQTALFNDFKGFYK